jgi:hypothetical protein
MSTEISFYDQTTGIFHSHWIGPEKQIAANTPPNCKYIAGKHELYASRVDVASGAVVDHIPAAPSPNHIWDPQAKRHVWSEAALQRHAALTEIERLEKSQSRALREHALGMPEGTQRLAEIDRQITALRLQVASVPVPPAQSA